MDLYKVTIEKTITDLKAGVTDLKKVEIYRDQFNERSPYVNNPPEVFIDFTGIKILGDHTADMKIGVYAMLADLYVVCIDREDADSLTLLEKIINFLDGYLVKPAAEQATRIKIGETNKLGYLAGGASVFRISAEFI